VSEIEALECVTHLENIKRCKAEMRNALHDDDHREVERLCRVEDRLYDTLPVDTLLKLVRKAAKQGGAS